MREIKFRAWHKEERRMSKPFGLGEEVLYDTNNNYFATVYEDEMVIMQYTGLRDKNGREIYEGDIVYVRFEVEENSGEYEEFIGVVVFDQRLCMFGIALKIAVKVDEEKGLGRTIMNRLTSFDEWDEIEVIGNIYELLEGVANGKA